MKKGRSLNEVLQEIEEFSRTKEDFIVNTDKIEFNKDGGGFLRFPDMYEYELTELAHTQLSGAINIPAKYYNRMREEAPGLLERNVNHWFRNNPMKRMVRTLNGQARAFLSDRYRRIDNEDLAGALLPVLNDFPGISIESCEATPNRFYIKAVTESLTTEISKGDIVYGGVVLSNSEVGQGALKIEPLIYRLVCLNGLIIPDYGMKKFHIGRAQETETFFSKLSDETIEADDKAFWLKARDVLKAVLSEDVFGEIANTMREAAEDIIPDPIVTVERLSKKNGFNLTEQKSILTNLLSHEKPTRYGLCNAVTRTAQEVESYDRATELEYAGSDILLMNRADWKEIALRPLFARK